MKVLISSSLFGILLMLCSSCSNQDGIVPQQALEDSRGTALSSDAGEIAPAGGKWWTSFTSPIPWKLDTDGGEWITVTPAEDSQLGRTGTTAMCVSAGMNISGAAKNATIRFLDEEGEPLQSLTVTQEPVTFRVFRWTAPARELEAGDECEIPFDWDNSFENKNGASPEYIRVLATVPWQIVRPGGVPGDYPDTLRTNPGADYWVSMLKGERAGWRYDGDIWILPYLDNEGKEDRQGAFDIIPVYPGEEEAIASLGVYRFSLHQSFKPEEPGEPENPGNNDNPEDTEQ